MEASLEDLISITASSRLDLQRSETRNRVKKEVLDLIQKDSGLELSKLDVPHSSSISATKRVVECYCDGLNCSDDGTVIAKLSQKLCETLSTFGDHNAVQSCLKRNLKVKQPMIDSFLDTARSSKSFAPALSLGIALCEERGEWIDVFIERALSGTFASARDLDLLHGFIKSITQDEWNEKLASSVGKQLKSNPERSMESINTILHMLNQIDVSKDLNDGVQLLPALLKQLKSGKPKLRNWSQEILIQLSSLKAGSLSLQLVCKDVATSLPSMIQADHRLNAYNVLETLAEDIDRDLALPGSVTGEVISGLLKGLAKDTKTASARDAGISAFINWMVIAKAKGCRKDDYQSGLAFLRKPLQLGTGSEVVKIFDRLVHKKPDMQDELILDLFGDSKVKLGVEKIVTNASKKSSSTAAIEGLFAIYLVVVSTLASGKTDLKQVFENVLMAGSATGSQASFLYGKTLRSSMASNPDIRLIVSRTLALYVKLLSKRETSEKLFKKGSHSSTLFAACISKSSNDASETSLQTVISYHPKTDAILDSLFSYTNEISQNIENDRKKESATRESRETFAPAEWKQKTKTDSADAMDPHSVRVAASQLVNFATSPKSLAKCVILMHYSSTRKPTGRQRAALMKHTSMFLGTWLSSNERKTISSDWANVLCTYCCDAVNSDGETISESLNNAALSALCSLGRIAGEYDLSDDDEKDAEASPHLFAKELFTNELAGMFAKRLENTLEKLQAFTKGEIDLFRSPLGKLFVENSGSSGNEGDSARSKNAEKKRAGGKSRRGKGNFGSSFEDEEWERQMKKELSETKKGPKNQSSSPSAEDLKQISAQDETRKKIGVVLETEYPRVLCAVRILSVSDIEVGNACLPALNKSVLWASICQCEAFDALPQLLITARETLKSLASNVYEISEEFAPSISACLVQCCKRAKSATESSDYLDSIEIASFPSPCSSASTVIAQMDDVGEELSGPSFLFLFPILKAALTGPRTVSGTYGALRVLWRHTVTFEDEPDELIRPLRKTMAATVLELLSHDRGQTFSDPSPTEVLVSCYNTDGESKLSVTDIAPLVDERGALGVKNCRLATMKVFRSIAVRTPEIIRTNPLVESRIWTNCFDESDDIRSTARRAWKAASKTDQDLAPPTIMYSISLLPLTYHNDIAISKAAAAALAMGMGLLPSSTKKNLSRVCSTYIESFPHKRKVEKAQGASSLGKMTPLPAKNKVTLPSTKKISTGLPKKKTAKKDVLSVAGIKRPKTGGKSKGIKTKVDSALLKPKAERTFDQEVLANQFKKEEDTKSVEDSKRLVATRMGMLRIISALTTPSANVALDLDGIKLLTAFLLAYGLADTDEAVRTQARDALRDVVAVFGASPDATSVIHPWLEGVLHSGNVNDEVQNLVGSLNKETPPRDNSSSDRRKEGAVVALGSVVLHLKGKDSDSKIESTIDMLLGALKTPNEGVQASVAAGLVKLMRKGKTQTRVDTILHTLMHDCLSAENPSMRRGASYGVSSVVKGSGIASLKKYGIIAELEDALSSSTSSNYKEGALVVMELLSSSLGLLFEPFVIVLLPSLLKSFSDGSDRVRTAASKTAGLIMSKLSAHGVKLVMPAVLTSFNDPAWRTKQASIHMLGSMSNCAPKQLASALPNVVPRLTDAFSDTHPKVRETAESALDDISKVVKNPEISSISHTLLNALKYPSEWTLKALEALIEMEFLHSIDAPSLALIIPILHRGLRDRVATTKRFGALITGNICTMINDPKDFSPYLPTLIPDLKLAVLDPIPDVRSTSAKAIGSLSRGLGEDALPGMKPWLIGKLRDEGVTSAERSGAAQGLSEVLIADGASIAESVVKNEIIPLRSHTSAATREGVLWVLTFLPPSLGQSFVPLIDASLPALIGGMSDESEPVRDVAMRAARVLIRSHGRAQVNKILPSLESGLTSEDYRIRVASLTLLGDLLSMIGGTTVIHGDGDTQDDIRKAERAQAQIALVLGQETRKRVLCGLYLARSDVTSVVRQSAVQVWKTVVSVTARTLREILPVLVGQIVSVLASGHPERTQVAGKCLGDVVNKLGDSVLPEVIPVLADALYDGDEHTRRGVCIGLSDVIDSSTKEQIEKFIDSIVKVVRNALCDEDEGVRDSAAICFQNLYDVVGSRALEETVPSLLIALESETGSNASRSRALNGLAGVLRTRSRELLPYIIPRIISVPITINHSHALGEIAKVTKSSLHLHFQEIVPAVLSSLAEITDQRQKEALRDGFRSVCHNVDEGGINWLVSEIASKCASDKAVIREESCWMYQAFVEERTGRSDFYEVVPVILRELIYRCNDDNPQVLAANHKAFGALSKVVPSEELVKHIEFISSLFASMVSDARRRKGGVGDGEFFMPGFNMPKGLEPLLPIYQRGILYGNANIREVSASGLGQLISVTASKYLSGQLVIKMTGPLLRIVGDRNPTDVKIAILRTLGVILAKGGPSLRAFVPQFQTTFVKALADPSRQVRNEAIKSLSFLIPLSTRVDPLIKELVSGSLGKNTGETGAIAAVQNASLEALALVLSAGGKKTKLPTSVPSALDAGKELLKHRDDGVRESAAKVVGRSCKLLGSETTISVIEDDILEQKDDESAEVRHGVACVCYWVMALNGDFISDDKSQELTDLLLSYTEDSVSIVKEAACAAIGAAVGSATDPHARLREVEGVLLRIMKNSNEKLEVLQALGKGLCLALHISKDIESKVDFIGKDMLDACLQLAMSGTQRVQYSFNDVLWLALEISSGDDGLDAYLNVASFDNTKAIKSLQAKVLGRITDVTIDI